MKGTATTITVTVLMAAALILSSSIIPMSLVQAQIQPQPPPPISVPPTTMPLPPGVGPPPTPEQLANSSKIPDNLFQICTAMTSGKPIPKLVFSANSKKIPAPYGTQLPLCSLFPQFKQQSQTIFPQSLPPGSAPGGYHHR